MHLSSGARTQCFSHPESLKDAPMGVASAFSAGLAVRVTVLWWPDGCSILCFLIVGDFLPPQHTPEMAWQGQELGELVLLPPQQRWVVHFHECHSLSFVPHRSSSPHTGLVSPSSLESFFFFFLFSFLLFRAVPTAYGSPLGVELELQPQPQQYQI